MPLLDVLTIDGPAGAGKSTVSRLAARRLGYSYLDTGAMYRAATLRVMRQNINWDDPDAVAACVRNMDLMLEERENGLLVCLDGEDVTVLIRTPEVTRLIYKVDQNPQVRAHLARLQRQFGERRPTVAEGRDMGTVVFPDAKCKIFLDASLEERVKRRAKELSEKGILVDLDELRRDICDRDEKNRTRATAPLKPAPDAVYLDSSGLTIDEVVDAVLQLARKSGLPNLSVQ